MKTKVEFKKVKHLHKLDEMAKGFKELKGRSVEVGVFSSPARTDLFGKTNAEVGSEFEVDTGSWLKVPLMLNLKTYLGIPMTGKDDYISYKPYKNPLRFLDYIGRTAMDCIREAFKTQGGGTWKPNHPLTVKRKGHDRVGFDSEQLYNSITFRIK